jgi:hypothetical protein
MGSGASSPSVPGSMRMSRKNVHLGATSRKDTQALPPPISLNTVEEALAAGYTMDQIQRYKSSFEYFERTNEECGFTNVSLSLKPPTTHHLLEGAAGLVQSDHGPLVAIDVHTPEIVGRDIILSAVRGGGRKAADPAYWDQCGGLHRISSAQDYSKVSSDLDTGGWQTGLKAVVIGYGKLVINLISLLLKKNITNIQVICNSNRVGEGVWTSKAEQYYLSVWRTLGVKCLPNTSITMIKFDDETGWVDNCVTSGGITISGNIIIVAEEQNDATTASATSATSTSPENNSNKFSNKWNYIAVGNTQAGEGTAVTVVEYSVDVVLEQQLQFESSRLAYNQQRRREKQGLSSELIMSNQSPRALVTCPKQFGAWFHSDGVVVGAFLEGGSPEENESVTNIVRSNASWPLQ